MSNENPEQPAAPISDDRPEDATAVQPPIAPTFQQPAPPPPPPPPAAVTPGAPAPYQAQPDWQQPAPPLPPLPATVQQAVPATSNNAVIALILSIVSWLVCPIIVAIVALVFASKADKEIKASNGWLTGHGLVLSAKILSWINIGFYLLVTVVMIIVFIVAAASGGLDPNSFPSYEESFSFGA